MWKILFILGSPIVFAIEIAIAKRFLSRRTFYIFAGIATLAACKALFLWCFGSDCLPLAVAVPWTFAEATFWFLLLSFPPLYLLSRYIKPLRASYKWIALGIAVAFSLYGTYGAFAIPVVRERTISFPNLPAEFDGYRIVHLSDIHVSSIISRSRIERIVERVNEANGDLIAITGDFVDGIPSLCKEKMMPIANLKAKDGVVASTGNHDRYWAFNEWLPLYQKWGIRFLFDDCIEVVRDEAQLAVGGLNDPAFGGNLDAVFARASDGAFRIIMFHRPTMCNEISQITGASLQLSGHTHGGAMPIFSYLVGLANEGHACGVYHCDNLVLFVSPGTGQWAGFPLRLFNPAEITVLRLAKM